MKGINVSDAELDAKYVWVNHTYSSPGAYNIAVFVLMQSALFILNKALALNLETYMLWFPTLVIFLVIVIELVPKK